MEYLINPLYWSLLYDPSVFKANEFRSYIGPYMNHLAPMVLLNLELIMNRFYFNSDENLRHIILMGLVYIIINYSGTLIMGRPIYFFLNYEDYTTAIVLANILLFLIFIYLSLCWVNNTLKFRMLKNDK